jgi:trans-aconitate methyltransferase
VPRERLRTTFEEVADLYEQARPTYPPEVFDDLAALARLPSAARIVEVGCGTGQATLPLAERGYEITCVELGEQLASVARRKLAHLANVEVINANFETWRPTRTGCDAAVAFTSFHWIAPETRYAKTASILRQPDEYLAVLNTYSGHRALDGATRERLLSRIRRRIDARPGRRVRKTYLALLNVAERA